MNRYKTNPFFRLSGVGLKISGQEVIRNVSFELKANEALAITGNSGSGKTLLGKLLAGQIKPSSGELAFHGGLKRLMVDQQDHFIFFSGRKSLHYGQRYENGMDNVPTVTAFLQKLQPKNEPHPDEIQSVMEKMEISHLADSRILELSNGERKRTQLAAALLQNPGLLVLDQPFVGLDNHAREKLESLLAGLTERGLALAVICSPQHVPSFVQKVAELQNGRLNQFVKRENYLPQAEKTEVKNAATDTALVPVLPEPEERFQQIVSMKQVQVKIGEKVILKDIDWEIRGGEQWALLGPNGAGKTTLLSLITADNPQGYNNHLILFDRQRGSGESIWDIKKRIGFVSPELHLYFLRGAGIFNSVPGLGIPVHQTYSSLTCLDVVLSGFRDEVGAVSASTDYQVELAAKWLSVLKLEQLKKRLFIHASLGEQRSVLLARALVKSPALLILDEPCQGLDHQQTNRFVQLLDVICEQRQTTMVYVTHQTDEIPSSVSHLLQLEKGRVKFCGEFRKE